LTLLSKPMASDLLKRLKSVFAKIGFYRYISWTGQVTGFSPSYAPHLVSATLLILSLHLSQGLFWKNTQSRLTPPPPCQKAVRNVGEAINLLGQALRAKMMRNFRPQPLIRVAKERGLNPRGLRCPTHGKELLQLVDFVVRERESAIMHVQRVNCVKQLEQIAATTIHLIIQRELIPFFLVSILISLKCTDFNVSFDPASYVFEFSKSTWMLLSRTLHSLICGASIYWCWRPGPPTAWW
jgi:hypothetical protein